MSTTSEPARSDFSRERSLDAIGANATVSIPVDRFRHSKVIPLYKVMKKNKQEAASFFSKTIKSSLDDEMIDIIEPYGTAHLTTAIKQTFNQDKLLTLASSSNDLERFDFNNSNKFSKTVKSKLFIRPGSHNGYAILHVPAFIPAQDLNVPENATNFKITARLVCLSDFVYLEDRENYVLRNEETHGVRGSFETTMLPVLRMQTQPITSQIRVNQRKPVEGGMSSVLIVALKFYSYNKGRFMHLASEGSMQVLKVF